MSVREIAALKIEVKGLKTENARLRSLLSYCERIEHIEEEKKSAFDKKALKEVLKRRKMDENDARELDFSVDVYKKALGMD